MLMQTHSCFWKLGTCIRVPTVAWPEIDRVSKIASDQKKPGHPEKQFFSVN